ncbi:MULTISPECIES: phenol hydroxylase subunit P4 [Methylibium]|uniref:Phenol hydrolase gammma subunit n=1 Tax=Methylibium petroleiphilum (strain ATCC BAA-1232 / LMG 22953 / PM1) TaxID=420662 RepID=A2SI48_METPP|nr:MULTISPECIES: phenol hydroxylase subunit P4 [Methylibium]ABM95237.1 phenol hydrolase gammma subunit [Methylibium petroleiphilum PM1]KQW65122.1 phenol hydroxylase [Methylibium sp. Root1272]
MPTIALKPGYSGPVEDTEDKFHGNRLLYICWDEHLLFCAPVALPLPATMPFGALQSQVLPGIYGSHPDFAQVDWSKAVWTHGSEPFQPDPEKSLADNGLVHKSVIRFRTPGLHGIQGSRS